MRNYYLNYETRSQNFVFSDAMVADCENAHEVPFLELNPNDYGFIKCLPPAKNAPLIGFVMKRGENGYIAEKKAVTALAKTGAAIRFLTYEHAFTQIFGCKGVYIPNAAFSLNEDYFVDCKTCSSLCSAEALAAMVYVCGSLGRGIPILATGSGAQVVAGELGLQLYRNFSFVETPIAHLSSAEKAHRLNIFADTPLQRMFGKDNLFFVNSRHDTLLAPIKVQFRLLENKFSEPMNMVLPLQVYAEANDGVPEAWGNEKSRILCLQWLPEEMIAAGDEKMQLIYQWLANESGK